MTRVEEFSAPASQNSFAILAPSIDQNFTGLRSSDSASAGVFPAQVLTPFTEPLLPTGDAALSTRPSRQAAVVAHAKLTAGLGKSKAPPRTSPTPLSTIMPVSSPMDTSPIEPFAESPSSLDLPTPSTASASSVTLDTSSVPLPVPTTSLTTPCASATDPRDLAVISLTAEVASMKLALEQLLSAVSDLKAENAALRQQLSPPERPLSSYSDIVSAPSLPPPGKKPKPLPPPPADMTRAEQIVGHIAPDQLRRCFDAPLPVLGLAVVHVDGYRPIRGQSPAVFSSILEVKFNFPRRHVFNVSTITDRLVELVIDASSLDQLKSALSGPSCTLRLLTDLDVSSPLLANISAADAQAAFHKRLDKDIARLKQSARPLLLRVAKLLSTYKEDISIRSLLPRARPTPTYLSAFIPVNMEIDPAAAAPETSADMTQ